MSDSSSLTRVPCPLCAAMDSQFDRTVVGYALERCRACRMVFVNPQPSADDIGSFYTDRDVAYLIEFYARSATPSVLAGHQRKLEDLERLLPGKGRLLDFGCAAAYLTEAAANRGWDAVGVDLGEWVKEAAARRGFHGVRVGYLKDHGFAPQSFDVIYAAQVFEHLPKPLETLAELTALLRPGGLLYVDVPNYNTLPILLNRDDFVSNSPPHHLNFFTRGTLRRLLRAGGLRPIRASTEGGLKWENLLGRATKSEILDAHATTAAAMSSPTASAPAPQAVSAPARAPGIKGIAKRVVVGGVIKPIFYDWLGTGMLLYAVARKV